ncbi:MAG: hypothetical protein Q8Q50_10305 [Methylobacter sp.]|nr:hypothetical protein [Methylobacter sp.]
MIRLSDLQHELKEVAWLSLYFFLCFAIMLTLKKLFLADYQVEVNALSTAAVSALIVAKIVIILDKTPAGKRFDASHALGMAALYKTLVYALVTFLVLFMEKLFHAYREVGMIGQAFIYAWEHKDRNIMLGKVIVIGLTFFGYHLYAGLDRRLGTGSLRKLITQLPNDPN